ncbi:hypothetical protein NL676_016514 [Syzygium grande]|nr:hypothetical protein NL676_016514 [Syzygium grande]
MEKVEAGTAEKYNGEAGNGRATGKKEMKHSSLDELITFCSDACDSTNGRGRTALHSAVGGQTKVVKHNMLETPNLEDLINARDKDGNTALHSAALRRDYDMMNIVACDKRVDIRATNKERLA